MKRALWTLALGLFLFARSVGGAQVEGQTTREDLSFRNEVQRAIDRGTEWLVRHQETNGCWSTADHPAVTALALQALLGDPAHRAAKGSNVAGGLRFILSCTKPDGSIHRVGLQNYNTSISMMALIATGDAQYGPAIRKARQWLLTQQVDLGEKGRIDSPFDGGVGYGNNSDHSDMNNTFAALEALYFSRDFAKDRGEMNDLNWAAAIQFIQNCQNLPGYNRESWASDDPREKGGFVYYPGRSMAGGETNAAGRVSLRSYGSISYAGMLSYIYADLKPDDPRVLAVFDWLRNNFSLEENPGMGQQGYYYYLNLMSKALNLRGVRSLELKSGKRVDWRREAAMKLINLQKGDGSWQNDQGRWWEKDPVLVTSYSLLALEIIHRGL